MTISHQPVTAALRGEGTDSMRLEDLVTLAFVAALLFFVWVVGGGF